MRRLRRGYRRSRLSRHFLSSGSCGTWTRYLSGCLGIAVKQKDNKLFIFIYLETIKFVFRNICKQCIIYDSSKGISGVQPKVLVRDESTSVALSANNVRLSPSFKGATHIVKFWDATEFPQLSANEFFCLKVAERSGLPVPPFRLAENAQALVIDRFDLVSDGTYFGFEDFCVLNARKTEEKYSGSYEGSILKRFGDFASPEAFPVDVKKLFTLIVLNCALRNGDAHLKNFGIIYDSVVEQARLAPVYDVVTTTVYIAKDNMALTLNGTTRWPDAKALQKVGETRTQNPPARINEIFEQIADAISETTTDVHEYMKSHSEFEEIGTRMLKEWELGRELSLRPSAPKSTSLSGAKV
jgi:serine/threonine-protein kinase HipA